MVQVLQIFKNESVFEKAQYTPEGRNNLQCLPQHIFSENAYVLENKLIISDEYVFHGDEKSIFFIVLIDYFQHPESAAAKNTGKTEMHCFYPPERKMDFDLFKFGLLPDNGLELFLNLGSNSKFWWGVHRENHKIAEIYAQKPIRYRINGKTDFSMTSRRQRHFYELDYLMQFYSVENIEKSKQKIQSFKKIPFISKTIDERKILH